MYIYRTRGLDIQLSVFVMATGDAKLRIVYMIIKFRDVHMHKVWL